MSIKTPAYTLYYNTIRGNVLEIQSNRDLNAFTDSCIIKMFLFAVLHTFTKSSTKSVDSSPSNPDDVVTIIFFVGDILWTGSCKPYGLGKSARRQECSYCYDSGLVCVCVFVILIIMLESKFSSHCRDNLTNFFFPSYQGSRENWNSIKKLSLPEESGGSYHSTHWLCR